MRELVPHDVQCPYCGENIEVLLDCSIEQQNYIEDCQVCCQAIRILYTCSDGELLNLAAEQAD